VQKFNAAGSAKWLRKQHRNRMLTHAEYVVGETMLWSCRGKDSDRGAISYSRICELAGVSKTTAVKAVEALTKIGFIRKVKRRALVPWMGGLASRQVTNLYVFAVAAITEFSEWSVNRKQVSKIGIEAVTRRRDRPCWPVPVVVGQQERDAARDALAKVRAQRAAVLGLAPAREAA
jgi:hypothetical protein